MKTFAYPIPALQVAALLWATGALAAAPPPSTPRSADREKAAIPGAGAPRAPHDRPASNRPALALSVYATAGDILRHLAPAESRDALARRLREMHVSRVFLEGRRGDEYVPPATLREVREFLESRGLHCAGGIATVPGSRFGVKQKGPLGWLNWQNEKTRQDVAGFFLENAPIFDELIVDDFYCTADTSPESDQARGSREWPDYRRDLLVSLIPPMILQPARQAHPGVRLIIKFPQWYDRFHLFGYDPPRMIPAFDQVWVGTEVRNPKTQRMGFVQPTEGYMNFRWLASLAGPKIRGAWFDHIECTPENFIDQAFQSVLAGARELTLFRLGDIAEGHPGDALLARRWPELIDLAEKLEPRPRRGLVFYKPPGSPADDNLYLADYLGMLGLPILPDAAFPADGPAVFLGAQAASDPEILTKSRLLLRRGGLVIVTPAFVRRAGAGAAQLSGLQVETNSIPVTSREVQIGKKSVPLAVPLELDAGVRSGGARILIRAGALRDAPPFLTLRREGRGRIFVLNVRTFSEEDFRAVGEWLLCPRPRGLPDIPKELADELRRHFLAPFRADLQGPTGVGLYLFDRARCLYNFRDDPITVRLSGQSVSLSPHQWHWMDSR